MKKRYNPPQRLSKGYFFMGAILLTLITIIALQGCRTAQTASDVKYIGERVAATSVIDYNTTLSEINLEDSLGTLDDPYYYIREDPLENEHIQEAILNKEDKVYPLTDEELDYVCKVVTRESEGEPYLGQLLVAQCVLDNCIRDGADPITVCKGKFAQPQDYYTESVWCAVTAIFFEGEVGVDDTPLWFYSPKNMPNGSSAFHDSQRFIIEVGGHRFFGENI